MNHYIQALLRKVKTATLEDIKPGAVLWHVYGLNITPANQEPPKPQRLEVIEGPVPYTRIAEWRKLNTISEEDDHLPEWMIVRAESYYGGTYETQRSLRDCGIGANYNQNRLFTTYEEAMRYVALLSPHHNNAIPTQEPAQMAQHVPNITATLQPTKADTDKLAQAEILRKAAEIQAVRGKIGSAGFLQTEARSLTEEASRVPEAITLDASDLKYAVLEAASNTIAGLFTSSVAAKVYGKQFRGAGRYRILDLTSGEFI